MAKYNIEFKKRVVKYYFVNGTEATLRQFNYIARETLYRWVRKNETVGLMRKKNKKYSADEKLKILQFFWEKGHAATELEYQINSGTLHVWNKVFEDLGYEGLKYDGKVKKTSSGKNFDELSDNEKLEYLMIENEYLKKLDALVTEREKRERKKK